MERAFRSQDFIAEMDRVPCIRHSASVGALPPLSIIPEKADLVCFAISRILHFEGERWAYVLQVDRIPATTCNGLRGRGESRSARTFEAFDVVWATEKITLAMKQPSKREPCQDTRCLWRRTPLLCFGKRQESEGEEQTGKHWAPGAGGGGRSPALVLLAAPSRQVTERLLTLLSLSANGE